MGVAITGRSHSIAEHFYAIHVERLEIERVPVVMATKILVGNQANNDEVRQRAIAYPVKVLGCDVRWDSEVLDLDFRIRYPYIFLQQQLANRQF